MREIFETQLNELQNSLLQMGKMIENILDLSLNSLIEQDIVLADKVIEFDDEIDKMEVDIEMKCLELIALQQPKAKDLRKISTILKIITDLERIADHGVNIAEITKKIGKEQFIKPLIDIPKMAELVKMMVSRSLYSFVTEDVELAKEVAKMDDLVDRIYEDIYIELLEMLSVDKNIMKQAVNLLFIGRYLERVADHTTNICERIIYMISGKKVKY